MRPLPTGEPWGDYAVSTARWTGALLHDVLAQAQPGGRRRRRPVRGRRPRRLPPPAGPARDRPGRPDLRPRPAARARRRPGGGDPDRLRDERRAAARPTTAPRSGSSCPHWYAVASVKWLKRIDVLTEPYAGEFQTGHYIYEWPDRPHEPVTLMRVRARITDPAPGVDHRRRHLHRPRQGLVRHRPGHQRRRQPHRRRRLAPGAARAARRALPVAGLVLRLGRRPTSAGTPSAPGRPTPPATSNPTSRPGTGSATATTPSRSSTSTWSERTRERAR